MNHYLKKIKVIVETLGKHVYESEVNLSHFHKKEGFFKNLDAVNQSALPWIETRTSEFWGGIDQNAWYRFQIEIPSSFKGKCVGLFVSTGEYDLSKEETTINPQILAYLDGVIIQGFDINHREFIITEESLGNETYTIDLKVNSGMFDRKFFYVLKLVCIDKATRNLYYNIRVPMQVAERLDDGNYNKLKMVNALKETIEYLDLRVMHSEAYNQSVSKANRYIENSFYKEACGHSEAIASVVGHTHIDVAWLWTVSQTREKLARSFSTVLNLMSEYPEYKFMSSSPQLYEFLKEDYPELFQKVKEKIKEGRWEADGAMWVESDCNLISGESFVRQFLYGLKFFREELESECKVLWLPDVFGYTGSLPQIIKKCGIDYFVSCKMGWSDTNRLPYDTFMWKGIDGTAVLSHMITTTYPRQSVTSYATDYNGQLFPETVMGAWDTYRQQLENKDVLITFGYGDGGGGPNKEMLENQRRMHYGIPGCPRTQMKTVRSFLSELDMQTDGGKSLPEWSGELYLETHRGTYTSMARNKKANRKCEIELSKAEKLNTIALKLLDHPYPKVALDSNWKTVLTNQFHDILPGSSIKEVYDVTKMEYEQNRLELKALVEAPLYQIKNQIHLNDTSIVVFNFLAFERSDVVLIERSSLNQDLLENPFVIKEESGTYIPYQLETENLVFYAKDVPSMGYKTYQIEAVVANTDWLCSEFIVTPEKIQNKFIKIAVDDKGTFTSIFDRQNNREILKEGRRGNRILCYENKPIRFTNWNIDKAYKDKVWEVEDITSIEVIENGPVRKILSVKKTICNSICHQNIIVYADMPRIDFDTFLDWKESDILLKVNFPVAINTTVATCDIAFGTIERTTHNNTSWDQAQYEIPAHKWVDLSEEGFGVSLLNDCKYGYDVKLEELNLTLLKPGTFPNPSADIEAHQFVYALYPHPHTHKKAKTHQQAMSINEPLVGKFVNKQSGHLAENLSFFKVDCDNVILDTLKKSETSNSIVLRVYENHNKRCQVKLSTYFEIEKVVETNLIEHEIGLIPHGEKSFVFELKPFEVKTFKLNIK